MASGDSCYYEDFTVQTGWEKFIFNLETKFTAWELSKYQGFTYDIEDFDLSWDCQSAGPVLLNDVKYDICYYSLKKGSCDTEHDTSEIDNRQEKTPGYLSTSIHHIFSKVTSRHKGTQCPCVAYMFDVPEFILVKPGKSEQTNNKTLDESHFNLLLSSVTIAISNIHCGLPVFIQAGEQMENFYEGVYIKDKFVGSFEMVHLAKPPEHCIYLSGILDVFKSKVKSNRTSKTISVSSCFTYTIPNNSTWLGFKQINHLPLGLVCNPICGLRLSAIWFNSSEVMLTDNPTVSGFEPSTCNYHRISLVTVNPAPQGRLAVFLERILKLGVIGLCKPTDSSDFEILPIQGKNNVQDVMDISDLDFCSESFDPLDNIGNSYIPSLQDVKTAPPDGLVQALALMILRSVNDSNPAGPEVWGSFVNLLHEHWENLTPIPGVKDGPPDHNTCLLNQKIQMLNFCIQRKMAELAGPDKFFDADLSVEESEGEEEFIECKDKSESDDMSAASKPEPEGRKEIVPGLLTLATGEPIYVPCLQEAVQLEEDALERCMELNTSLTLSYMEAFKAANPSAFFRDFIRWFSPRDWIEEDGTDEWGQKTGHLSDRMLVPGNKWISMWTRAKPKAAIQQPSVFDHDAHAESILKWFGSMHGYKLVTLILPLLAQKAVERLILHEESVLAREILAEYFTKDLCDSLRGLAEQPTVDAYREFLRLLHEVEVVASLIISVCDILKGDYIEKLAGGDAENVTLKEAIFKLVSGKEVNLTKFNGRLKAANLLREYQKYYDNLNAAKEGSVKTRQFSMFPLPDTKEFILSVTTPRPGPNSKPSPQRMYACVNSRLKDELTMAACFVKDTYYR